MRTKPPFTFHSDMLPLGVYQEIEETVVTPAISNMVGGTTQTFYGAWHDVNPTGIYTFDIRWTNPDLQMADGAYGQPMFEPNKIGYVMFGGYAMYSDINASFQAGEIGIRFYPYTQFDKANNRWRIAINVFHYYWQEDTGGGPFPPFIQPLKNVPSKSWDCIVSIYSIPATYGQ